MKDNIKQNTILYYADYLSLRENNIPVTDNCKYYFIHNIPTNSAYIVDKQPFYDEQNQYIIQATNECRDIIEYSGEEGVNSFLERICNLSALGCIDAVQMLQCINYYRDRKERKQALKTYNNWNNNKKYYHTVRDDDGELHREQCSEYVARAEQGTWTNPTFNVEGSIIQP